MKPILRRTAENAKIGIPCKPLKIEDKLIIMQVDDIETSKLDSELEERLLKDILNEFIVHGVDEICSYVYEKE